MPKDGTLEVGEKEATVRRRLGAALPRQDLQMVDRLRGNSLSLSRTKASLCPLVPDDASNVQAHPARGAPGTAEYQFQFQFSISPSEVQ